MNDDFEAEVARTLDVRSNDVAGARVSNIAETALLNGRRLRRRRRASGVGTAAAGVVALALVFSPIDLGSPDQTNVPAGPSGQTSPPSPSMSRTPAPLPDATPSADESIPEVESPDGWTQVDGPDRPQEQRVNAAIVVGDTVVAVGTDVANAGDGIAGFGPGVWLLDSSQQWTSLDSAALGVDHAEHNGADFRMSDVAVGADGVVVAVGSVNWSTHDQPAVWRSTDGGRTWSMTLIEVETSAMIEAVTWTGNGFIAVGGAGLAVWTSPDGGQWSQRTVPGDGYFVDVLWMSDLDQLVAVSSIGDSTEIWIGRDGADPAEWSRFDTPAEVAAIAAGPTGLIATAVSRDSGSGEFDGVLLTSPNGQQWNVDPRSDALGGEGDQFMRSVLITSDGRTMVAGQDGSQGTIWTMSESGTEAATFVQDISITALVEDALGPLAFGLMEVGFDRDGSGSRDVVVLRSTVGAG